MERHRVVTPGDVVVPSPEYEGEKLGPVGQRVVFEDERVRVWDIVLEPGGYFGLHKHELDYVIVCLEGAKCRTQELQKDGSWREFDFDFLAGDIIPVYVNGGQTHRLFSTNSKRFVNRLIEFKSPPLDPPPLPVSDAIR
jgi:hypothetical protein